METCKQSLRGAVVVQYTYGWDILAETGRSGQPHSPEQSSQLQRVRWARGDSRRWTVTSQRWPVAIRPLTSMSGPRVRQDKSMTALPRPDGICQATALASRNVIFLLEASLR